MVSLVLGLGELIVLRQRISVIPRNFRSWGKPLFGLTSCLTVVPLEPGHASVLATCMASTRLAIGTHTP